MGEKWKIFPINTQKKIFFEKRGGGKNINNFDNIHPYQLITDIVQQRLRKHNIFFFHLISWSLFTNLSIVSTLKVAVTVENTYSTLGPWKFCSTWPIYIYLIYVIQPQTINSASVQRKIQENENVAQKNNYKKK